MRLVDLVNQEDKHSHSLSQQTRPNFKQSLACLQYLYITASLHPPSFRRILDSSSSATNISTSLPTLASTSNLQIFPTTRGQSSVKFQHRHVSIPSSACLRNCYLLPLHPHVLDGMHQREQHPASHRAASPLREQARVKRHRASTLLSQCLGRRSLGGS